MGWTAGTKLTGLNQSGLTIEAHDNCGKIYVIFNLTFKNFGTHIKKKKKTLIFEVEKLQFLVLRNPLP